MVRTLVTPFVSSAILQPFVSHFTAVDSSLREQYVHPPAISAKLIYTCEVTAENGKCDPPISLTLSNTLNILAENGKRDPPISAKLDKNKKSGQ